MVPQLPRLSNFRFEDVVVSPTLPMASLTGTEVPLVLAAVLFAAFMAWRMRPALGPVRRADRSALRAAKQRIEAAKTPPERALALCDAGDACAKALGSTSAVGYYLRAMRADPTSAALPERAAIGLAKRPHALESLLWRRLGAEPWDGASRAAAIVALRELAFLYEGPLRSRAKARAIDFALAALGEPPRKPVEE
jgi:hypothetical protein